MSPTPSALLSALANRGTRSADDLARELGCGVGPVLALLHSCWWETEPIAGPSGWLYRLRQVARCPAPNMMGIRE